MPQKRSAYKEIRKAKKRHPRNLAVASEVKTIIRQYNALLSSKKYDEAKKFLVTVSSKLSKAAKKGVLHKNAVSRKISRLSKKLHSAIFSKK